MQRVDRINQILPGEKTLFITSWRYVDELKWEFTKRKEYAGAKVETANGAAIELSFDPSRYDGYTLIIDQTVDLGEHRQEDLSFIKRKMAERAPLVDLTSELDQ